MLRIGEVAKRTGLGIETVRYYEKVGAVAPPPRGANGYRVYSKDHVRRLLFIRRARQLGFSLDDVCSLLALTDRDRADCRKVKAIASRHLEEINCKIADLRRVAGALRPITDECPGSDGGACPIFDALLEGKLNN